MTLIFRSVLMGALFGTSAWAQSAPDLLSDREVLASYCLGSARAAIGTFRGRDGGIIDGPAPLYFRARERIFLEYLTSKGLFTGARSQDVMLNSVAAAARGRADQRRCDGGQDAACNSILRCEGF
jgi:hypothetical protein